MLKKREKGRERCDFNGVFVCFEGIFEEREDGEF